MNIDNLGINDIRALDKAGTAEAEGTIKRALADIRMDLYGTLKQKSHRQRALRRTLARVLTVKRQTMTKAKGK